MCVFFRFQNISQLFCFSYHTFILNTTAISMTIVMNFMDVAHLWRNFKIFLISPLKKFATSVCIFLILKYSTTILFFLLDLNLKLSGHFHDYCLDCHGLCTPIEKFQKILTDPLKNSATFVCNFLDSKIFHKYFYFFLSHLYLKYNSHFHDHCREFHERCTPMENSKKILMGPLRKFATVLSIFHIPKYLTINLFFLSDYNLRYSGHLHGHCSDIHEHCISMKKSQKNSNLSSKGKL